MVGKLLLRVSIPEYIDDSDLTIRDVLNKLLWDPRENSADYRLTFVHRGAPRDVKAIPCNLIAEVESSCFTYRSEDEGEVLIPFHRVLEIRDVKTGRIAWKKRVREG